MAPTNRLYRVWGYILQKPCPIFHGNLSQCYEKFPSLACVEVGQKNWSGLWLELIEW